MQDIRKPGNWGIFNYNHGMGVWGFKSEDEAKDALLEELGIKQ